MDYLWIEFWSRFWRICIREVRSISVRKLIIVSLIVAGFVYLGCLIYAKIKKHSISLNAKLMLFLLIGYISFMAQVTFFNRWQDSQVRVFDTKWLWIDRSIDQNITNLLNIILFIPFGFLLAGIQRYQKSIIKTIMVLSYCFLTSLFIECSQYIARRGYFELDDIQANVLGGMTGGIFFSLCFRIERFVQRKYMEEA